MLTCSVQIEVLTTGDGENHSDTFNWPVNSNAVPPSNVFVSGNTPVSVPVNAAGAVIVAPSAAGTYTVKGVNGDTGNTVTAGGAIGFRFSAPGAVSSIVLSGSVPGIWLTYWA